MTEAELAWLERLRKYHDTVIHLRSRARRSLEQSRHWPLREGLTDVESGLDGLSARMAADIQAVEREVTAGDVSEK